MSAAWIVRGDARQLPLADKSVQCICTSPPFFNLRSYGGQASIWGGDPNCSHTLSDDPARRPMTGGTGAASAKQVTNVGTQFGNAFETQRYYVEGGGTAGSSKEAFSSAGPENAARIKAARWRTTSTCSICGAWAGELGSEATPQAFIAHLIEVFRECWRVLRDDGVCFVNMGSSYAGSGKGPTGKNGLGNQGQRQGFINQTSGGSRPKSNLLIPFRLAIALDEDGWIVRQDLIWAKPNPMPESVRDRWTSSHEYILMLVKQGRYYFDPAGIQEPATSDHDSGNGYARPERLSIDGRNGNGHAGQAGPRTRLAHPTRNGRSVWTIPTAQFPGSHFAVFNEEIPRRCILAATSEYGACVACGAPWRRSMVKGPPALEPDHRHPEKRLENGQAGNAWAGNMGFRASRLSGQEMNRWKSEHPDETTGWAPTCHCGTTEVRPCVVLDPFSGSGTTAMVADRLGRFGVGVEMSAEYASMASRRVYDDAPMLHEIAAAPALAQGALL